MRRHATHNKYLYCLIIVKEDFTIQRRIVLTHFDICNILFRPSAINQNASVCSRDYCAASPAIAAISSTINQSRESL